MKRIAITLFATGVALCLAAGAAGAAPGPAPGAAIGPNQLFNGFVNGSRPTATIRMACFGPIRPGQTGHPFSGQDVSVQRSVDVPGGNTGAAGTSIVVTFGPPAAATPAITLTRYGSKAIPTSLRLPCAGQGVAVFRPKPGSSTARSDRVKVTFVGQP
ncbi:MAG: hypothetical protein M3083_12740 [Actinomycetota bacterium]|nr:hypothetical protein [Actinomycetota bacterium]MDQ6944997.1 hypothetical protein [Actinomycetota bacterium]